MGPGGSSSGTWSLLQVQMNSRGGTHAADVRTMEVLETRLLEAQRAELQQERRGAAERPGGRGEGAAVLLRFGPAEPELRGKDALNAEV